MKVASSLKTLSGRAPARQIICDQQEKPAVESASGLAEHPHSWAASRRRIKDHTERPEFPGRFLCLIGSIRLVPGSQVRTLAIAKRSKTAVGELPMAAL